MDLFTTVRFIAIAAIPLLFAITAHEAAHGWVASMLGDRTAKMLGRVTFNPLRHIDLLGTVVIPIATLLLSGFVFGWAKPVPVDWRNLRRPRRDMALVAIAGPAANLVMALFWGLVVKTGILLASSSEWIAQPLQWMGAVGVLANLLLMVLNLLPLLPLDGGRVLNAFLPPRWAANFSKLEPYGLMILVLFLVAGVLGDLIIPAVDLIARVIPGGMSALQLLQQPMSG